MGKAEMVEQVAAAAGITKVEAEKAIVAFMDSIKAALKSGEKATFIGFGTFSVSDRKARVGRNPQSGAEIKIPARKAVKFTPGKDLKDSIQVKPAKAAKKKK